MLVLLMTAWTQAALEDKLIPSSEELEELNPLVQEKMCELLSAKFLKSLNSRWNIEKVGKEQNEGGHPKYRLYIKLADDVCFTVDSEPAALGKRGLKDLKSILC
ncbi:hypothetical protein FGIG_01290 [Fasciola gigantica]|uniref:Uncharacterized protein n=1 Tax=Fasciola gigantica TaxID=46835 RepID=A0A504YU68_FASGI|nr:hypothetical protein FGIG_01290 [Fasciola gigantica]